MQNGGAGTRAGGRRTAVRQPRQRLGPHRHRPEYAPGGPADRDGEGSALPHTRAGIPSEKAGNLPGEAGGKRPGRH